VKISFTSLVARVQWQAAFKAAGRLGALAAVVIVPLVGLAPSAAADPPGGWQVALAAVPPTTTAGSPVTLEATADGAVDATGYAIEIFDETTASLVGTPCLSGETCSASVTEDIATTQTFIAYVTPQSATYPPPGEVASSPGLPVIWDSPPPPVTPGPPTGVTASPGDQLAVVSWTPPSSSGAVGSITSYIVTASPGGQEATVDGATTTATVTGLTNGTSYTFTATAANSVGPGTPSSPSSPVTVGIPTAPTGVVAVGGNAQASLSWTAPSTDNGSPLSSYTITASPGGATGTVTGSPPATNGTVTGLANATSYTFTVMATNAAGTGPASAPSNQIEVGVPSAPTGVTATGGSAQASVSWSAPSNDVSPVTSYTITASPGGATAAVTGSPPATNGTVTGLANGTSYTFTVTATNSVGTGPASGPSNAVVPCTVPDAPTGVAATAGNQSAAVSWTAPGDGGSPITSYTVTASPGGGTATVSGSPPPTSGTVSGLSAGTSYTFTVTATNAAGTGPASAPSGSVVVVGPPAAPSGVSAVAGNGAAMVSWAAPANNGGAITSYTVTASPGGSIVVDSCSASQPTTNILVTGLSDGTTYQFSVTATNANGTGPPAAYSSGVAPASGDAPVVSISACPTSLAQGQDTTLTATTNALPSGGYLEIGEVTDGAPFSANAVNFTFTTSSDTVSYQYNGHDGNFGSGVGTEDFQAWIFTEPGGTIVSESPVISATWS
jgi:hypothetical protein